MAPGSARRRLEDAGGRARRAARRSLTGLLRSEPAGDGSPPVPAGHADPPPADSPADSRAGADAAVATACHAPFSTLYFDTLGYVRPCCRNVTHPLGHVAEQSIREIWDGATTAGLRSALRADDFSLGCEWCSVHAAEGDDEHVYARLFDHFAPSVAEPPWPKRMEFSLSNTCNLACEMCNGELSSIIRRRREKLDPLPSHYGDAFFAELAEFLPHLHSAGFAGGEPFLAREATRVFDLLVEHAPHVRCNVATNGTIFGDRVARLLETLHIDVAVSMDGGSAEVFEAIRTGADFSTVVENLDRFLEVAQRRGTTVEIHHCLMPQNVERFWEILQLAEERDIEVMVNAVRDPKDWSLDYLDPDAMAAASASLDHQVEQWADRLPRNGATLRREATRLRRRIEALEGGHAFPELFEQELSILGVPAVSDSRRPIDEAACADLTAEVWPEPPYRLEVDGDERISEVDLRTAQRLGGTVEAMLGSPAAEVLAMILVAFGEVTGDEIIDATDDLLVRDVTFTEGRVRSVAAAERGDDGRVRRGLVLLTDLLAAPEPAT